MRLLHRKHLPWLLCLLGAAAAPPGGVGSVPGKSVWLLWLDGWDAAPWVAREVAASWAFHNPAWRVQLVSATNLHAFVDVGYVWRPSISPQARSDIIRLALLAAHGGVWADATMLCLAPLENWVYDAVVPAGVWMYHSGPPSSPPHALRDPASWFIVAQQGTEVVAKWKAAADAYWGERVCALERWPATLGRACPLLPPPLRRRVRARAAHYFWMDDLFRGLLAADASFRAAWERVPVINCEAPGQAAMLTGRVGSPVDAATAAVLMDSPPFAVKLSTRGLPATAAELEALPGVHDLGGVVAVRAARWRRPRGGAAAAFAPPRAAHDPLAAPQHSHRRVVGDGARGGGGGNASWARGWDARGRDLAPADLVVCIAPGRRPPALPPGYARLRDACGFCKGVPPGVACAPAPRRAWRGTRASERAAAGAG